jgi:hypothetical protein
MAPLFGRAGDIPLLGKWTGGSRTELGTYRPDPSGVSLDFSLDVSGTGLFSVPPDRVDTFGKATDVALIGDWDGSGKDEIGTYRLSPTEQAMLSPSATRPPRSNCRAAPVLSSWSASGRTADP